MVESLLVYNPLKKHFMLLSVKISVEVGSSAADIRLPDTVALTTKPWSPKVRNMGDTRMLNIASGSSRIILQFSGIT
jgi:hypothetical protein